jgi:hypothetical protein
MRQVRLFVCALVVAAGVVAGASTALASPAATPPATPGTASCSGLIVALTNHDSGSYGASQNPNSSAGPGYFLRSLSHDAILDVRAEAC